MRQEGAGGVGSSNRQESSRSYESSRHLSLRDSLNPSSVLRAACLRVGVQGAVRVAVLLQAPALRRRQRLRRVVAIKDWTG